MEWKVDEGTKEVNVSPALSLAAFRSYFPGGGVEGHFLVSLLFLSEPPGVITYQFEGYHWYCGCCGMSPALKDRRKERSEREREREREKR